jgi:diguanylate cyclase (GGDEF)-like protein
MSEQLVLSDYLIYVVDSDSKQLHFLENSLKDWGFEVRSFDSADTALEVMIKGELPHVLFADLQMKGLSGLGLTKRAKELSKEIEVVLMTATPTVESAIEALRLGVHDYLLKPFEKLEDIRNVIFYVCERIYMKLYNEYLIHELKMKNEEIRGLSDLSGELSNAIDASKTIEIGCRYISKAFNGAHICFLQYIPTDKTMLMTARSPSELFGGVQTKFPIPAGDATSLIHIVDFFKKLEKDEKFFEMLKSAAQITPKDLQKDGQWKIFPFITRSIPRGVFALNIADWDEEIQRPLMNHYLQTLEKYFENALLHKKVFEMSVRDGLTNVFNVRTFRERLEQEIRTAERVEHPVSLLFLDVDHFKKYNDNNGHPAGDKILKSMASLLQKNFRNTDFVARYGGEEFCVILPHTELESAIQKAEEFRQVIDSYPFPNAESQPLGKVSVSIGVSEFPRHASNPEQLIKLADDALYAAKKESRNVVKAAPIDVAYVAPFKSKHVTVGRK